MVWGSVVLNIVDINISQTFVIEGKKLEIVL